VTISLTLGAGLVLAARVNNVAETAGGAYVSEGGLTWWSEVALVSGSIPGTVPPATGSVVGTPVVLSAAGSSYRIGAATAGHLAQVFWFNETTAAPLSTEFEIKITVSVGGTPATTTTVGYLETRTTAPGSTLTYLVYFDTGAAALPGTAFLTTVTQLTQQCTGIGTCP